jgi:putative acetyltransferase
MEALERNARERGISTLRLETGIHQPEAIGLYEKLGFRKRDRFGEYPDDPVSVFMEKILC